MPYTEDLPEPENKTQSEDILGETETDTETEETDSESNTALIPRTMLGDKVKPGDKMQVEVVHLYEDEAEVKLSKPESESSDDEMEGELKKLDGYSKPSMS